MARREGRSGGVPNKEGTGPRVSLVANYTKSQALPDILKLTMRM